MKSVILKASLLVALLVVVSFVGTLPSSSDIGRTNSEQQIAGKEGRRRAASKRAKPLAYRSPGATHKLMIPAKDQSLSEQLVGSRLARRLRNYGEFSLVEVTEEALASIDARVFERAELRDDLNVIMLKRGQMDTTGPEPQIQAELRQPSRLAHSLHLVQLFGPPTPESLETVKATGAQVVSYVPNSAYLLWATPSQIARIGKLRETSDQVQWDGPYHPAYKISPNINLDSAQEMKLSVTIIDTPESNETLTRLKYLSSEGDTTEMRLRGAIHVNLQTEARNIKAIAKLADVQFIGLQPDFKLHDERQGQIIAGAITQQSVNNASVTRPTTPGYLAFLNSAGFNSTFNFAVDVVDTGYNTGSNDPTKVHPDFLTSAGVSRVAYLNDFTNDSHPNDPSILPAHDSVGHGTLCASIVGGFSNKTGDAFVDDLGYQYGLGIAPHVQIGISKIFRDSGTGSGSIRLDQLVMQAYRGGARVSSNSWGAGCGGDPVNCNYYETFSNIYDLFVRDSDLETFGNQQMTFIFSAGNDGDLSQDGIGNNSISAPGTAKNVITVGATENFRATDASGNSLRDACNWPGSYADNAQEIFSVSSGGRTQDGRAKPDIVAPGTHIVGAATQDALSTGICESGRTESYYPAGQSLYTWASGTSFAAPAVAGGAALAYQWLRTVQGADPSPAFVKALLLNSTSYIAGPLAGDNLPGVRQGWGLMDIGRAFEQTDRILYDESPARTFTQSGGAAFETTGIITDASKEFRVMLVWTDAPGSDVTNAPYVNQLNLEVVIGGVVYNSNNFSGQYSLPGGAKDFANNVQAVRLPAGTTGPFIIRVRPTIIADDGVPGNEFALDQDFALVVTNGRETAVPVLAIESVNDVSQGVSVLHTGGVTDQSLLPGETAKITVSVNNLSQTSAATVNGATLFLKRNNQTAGQSNSAYAAIQPGQSVGNSTPFDFQIPSDLQCGSVATFDLQLETTVGQFTLPIRIRVGRIESSGAVLLSDDVDGGRVKWKKKKGFGTSSAVGNSGSQSYHVEDPGLEDNDNRLGFLQLKKAVTIPDNAGQVRLSFFHIFNFEPGYDGGVLEISDDDGTTWQDIGQYILVGGYDGKVTQASNNPLGNRFAWTARGQRGVFSQVVINLDAFRGKRIRLRFSGGFDNAVGVRDGYTGWFIDDIQITTNTYRCN